MKKPTNGKVTAVKCHGGKGISKEAQSWIDRAMYQERPLLDALVRIEDAILCSVYRTAQIARAAGSLSESRFYEEVDKSYLREVDEARKRLEKDLPARDGGLLMAADLSRDLLDD